MRFLPRLAVVALLTPFVGGGASAADWYTGSAVAETPESWIVDVDTSVSVTSKDSVFAGAAATFAAVENLRVSGWRGRVEGLVGRYVYEQAQTGERIRSQQEGGGLMAGYEWMSRNTTAALWLGLDVKHTSLSSPDPENTVVGTGVGAKFAGQFYSRLSEGFMVSGYGSYSTLNNAYYGRLKAGWAIADQVYIGPEFTLLGDDFYRQYRVGVHLTGVRLGRLNLGISGGFFNDTAQGTGGYGVVDARIGF